MTRPLIARAVAASKNPDKIAEMEAVLAAAGVVGEMVRGLEWPDVVEDAPTLEGNALLKARRAAEATGLAAVADDTGLEVEALGGAPGVRTARFAGEGATYESNMAALLEALEGVSERSARFRTAAAAVLPDGREIAAEGVLEGRITVRPRGSGGFGYDPVFEAGGRTLAEMTPEEKNRISHRSRAVRALAAALAAL